MTSLLEKFGRKKIVDRNETSTQLARVLGVVDLTMLGIGSTLGIGVYVLAGSVAKESAGPAVVLSFLVAAFASVLAGLCYAEFGARVPKAGSAYVYSYVCVGELVAFIVGWNLIMEYVIGVASVAKGYSGYVDQLCGHAVSDAFKTYVPIKIDFLSEYFDAFAFAITLVLTVLLAFGVKESSFFNNIFTVLNLGIVLFVIVAGSFYAKTENWALKKEDILNRTNITAERIGEGGFAPFGFHGIMKGAATCFYGFVGFDCIATTGEEAKNPQRAIPLAIIFSLLFIFLAYFGISTVLTLMIPYYLQDAEAPLPEAFLMVGFSTGRWIVTVGALFGLSTSLLGAMFPLPRVIYAMASDGVLFKFLATVHPKFQTPLIATLLAGTFGGLMAAIFRLEALIDMMSIGTLTAYTLVAVCVLCLRYRKDLDGADDGDESETIPTPLSSAYTNFAVLMYCFFTIFFCAVAIFGEDAIISGELSIILLLAMCGFVMCALLVSLSCQPVSRVKLAFRVPLVPFLPGFSIMANIYLIMKLSGLTWIRFAVWMAVGFIIYGICLFSGTTDKSYQTSLDEKRKRRYSKISASGFDNKGLELEQDKLKNINGESQLNGNKKEETRMSSYPNLSSLKQKEDEKTQNASGPQEKDSNLDAYESAGTSKADSKPQNNVSALIKKMDNTETIERTVEFQDEHETDPSTQDTNDDMKAAEKVAVEAIDSVINQACVYASTQKSAQGDGQLHAIDPESDQSEEATMTFSEGSGTEETSSFDEVMIMGTNNSHPKQSLNQIDHINKPDLLMHATEEEETTVGDKSSELKTKPAKQEGITL